MPSPSSLGDALAKQAEILRTLGEVTVRQREALKEGRLELLQDLFREQQAAGFAAEAAEERRRRAASELAAALGCESNVSAICSRLPEQAALLLKKEADEVLRQVKVLQSEMHIISALVEENQRLNGMMAAEWR
ncbi:MAG TPA: flagellar export chaperone FlgN, partial [Synergistales bacterium]|nr:flagellar export chaperone FlgN [Synergistales bacterium]